MTDRDAILAAIRAHPHDDTVRLVLADWLDDHGEPEPCPGCGHAAIRGGILTPDPPDRFGNKRASVKPCPTCSGRGSIDRHAAWGELIRVQCELAKWDEKTFKAYVEEAMTERLAKLSWLERNESRDFLIPKCLPEARRRMEAHEAKRRELSARERAALPLAAPLLKVTPDGRLLDAGPCRECGEQGDVGTLIGRMGCPSCSDGPDRRGSGRRRVPCVVERGFPVALLTLAEAVGEVCRRCDGDGQRHGSERTYPPTPCAVCHGTGRTPPVPLPPGCGVRVTDREPDKAHWDFGHTYKPGQTVYGLFRDVTGRMVSRSWVPQDVWDAMRGGVVSNQQRPGYLWFPTRAAALAALHAAVLATRAGGSPPS